MPRNPGYEITLPPRFREQIAGKAKQIAAMAESDCPSECKRLYLASVEHLTSTLISRRALDPHVTVFESLLPMYEAFVQGQATGFAEATQARVVATFRAEAAAALINEQPALAADDGWTALASALSPYRERQAA